MDLFAQLKSTLRWDSTIVGLCWKTDPLLTRGDKQSLEAQVYLDQVRPT